MTSEERREARYQRRKKKREERRKERYGQYNDFDTVFSFDHLWQTANKCYKGVGWKPSTQRYRNQAFSNVCDLYRRLKAGTYKSRGFYIFTVIERGKTRLIRSVHISERNVQKCLYAYCLYPIFGPSLIYDNSASQKNKGVHFAIKRLVGFLKEFYKTYGTNEGYAFVYDFHGYFDNISHPIMMTQFGRLLTDPRLYALSKHFIDCFGEKGLGLGSQISQLGAILYPNSVDHAIKEKFQVCWYSRYMDDGNLITRTKNELRTYAAEIERRTTALEIEFNRKKTQIVKLSRGVPFLKRRFVLKENGDVVILPFPDSEQRMRRKIHAFADRIKSGKMTLEDAKMSYESWRSHLNCDNAYHVQKRMDDLFARKILTIGE